MSPGTNLQDCTPGHVISRSPSRPSENSLMDEENEWTSLPMDDLFPEAHARPKCRRISVLSSPMYPNGQAGLGNDDNDNGRVDILNPEASV
ncbi:hypothetical protein DPMN_106595 [Dreissena polymorpha]|uniref:Uncharacterized protein n=1 Tax=Dreissena polymorpha TaxID=45954 RepID=A0A9D4K5F5_DREPO|nr:hypothetical protein DPMN_106595 [Dreissena polymorpha]